MSIRSVLFAMLAGDGALPATAAKQAIAIAAHTKAHLTFAIGALKLPVNVPFGGSFQGLITKENDERLAVAHRVGEELRIMAQQAGIAATVDVASHWVDGLMQALTQRARLYDLTIVGRPRANDDHTLELAETLMFSSGRPLMVVPDEAKIADVSGHLLLAWDGSMNAARAVTASLPLLASARQIGIVSVVGEKDISREVKGADLAPMLAHHGGDVRLTELATEGRSVADTLLAHALQEKADLIIMGAYAHSRFRQMILGGMTRDMLVHANVPLLLAH